MLLHDDLICNAAIHPFIRQQLINCKADLDEMQPVFGVVGLAAPMRRTLGTQVIDSLARFALRFGPFMMPEQGLLAIILGSSARPSCRHADFLPEPDGMKVR